MASTSTTSDQPENVVMGAFHEIAPSASTSGTSSTPIQKSSYDVFINHRGPDVKKTLASRIYNILRDMKVTSFLDSEELEYGDFLPATLEAAIRSATLHIAIFSKSYAESVWCLAELACMLKSGAKIVLVFYYVEPTDLRYVAQRKGMYADAFERHRKKRRYSSEKLKEWEYALHKVSFYIGEIVKNIDDELRLLKNIVNTVQKEMSNASLMVAKHPVGLNETVEDFEKTLQLVQGDQGVQIVGIWGMGSSGKTTLAKELYNKRSSSMERSSFIFDIREAKGMLYKKQIQLLNNLGVYKTYDNIEQNKAILSKQLRSFKVLIILDDVDHIDQLDALLPIKDSLERGSLIIVTTRECEVLISWGISSIYKMKLLDSFNAEQLFCWHAFLQPSPCYGFEELVEKFLKACHGLPLSLKVFGGQLYGKSHKQYWESVFHKISRILPNDIKEKLKVSYNSLDDEEKEAFLDTACFFIGENQSLAIEVWDASGWSGLHSWERLFNKCLVELDSYNCIRMHDHLRDLGREIASQYSPSRFWLSQQIIGSDKQIEKRNHVRGIKAAPIGIEEQWLFRRQLEPNMNGEILLLAPYLVGLKILLISGDGFNEVIGRISRELIWFRWWGVGQRNLPSWLSLKKLRVLQLCEDNEGEQLCGDNEDNEGEQLCEDNEGEHQLEELWEAENDAPLELRQIDISNCHKSQRFPNSIRCLSKLKRITINGKNNVSCLPAEFCHLRSLEHLCLPYCQKISSLPNSFGHLTNLRYLNLRGCSNLRRLPVTFKNLTLLQHLDLHECTQLILMSDDFQNITELEFLDLYECRQSGELPRHITDQTSLKELNLYGLTRLRELPVEIGKLSRLREMKIGGLPYCHGSILKSLPNSLGNLSSLTHLSIMNCPSLESLPPSLGELLSLTNLAICSCPKLKCLPFSVGRLNLLERLDIIKCPISQVDVEMVSLSSPLSNLKVLFLNHTEVCRISISEDHYPRLELLNIAHNYQLKEIEAVPVNLERLVIKSCAKLDVLPSFARLTSLKKFEAQNLDRIERFEGLMYCTRLETLILHTCWEVPGVESLEHMEKLRMLQLRANNGSVIESCIQSIKKWPDEIIICMRAVPDASSLVDSFKLGLSPSLSVVDSFSYKDVWYGPELLLNRFSNRNAIMLCYVINSVDSLQMTIDLERGEKMMSGEIRGAALLSSMWIGEGTWAVMGVSMQRSEWLKTEDLSRCAFRLSADKRRGKWAVEVERGLVVRGEDQTLVEAFRHLIY